MTRGECEIFHDIRLWQSVSAGLAELTLSIDKKAQDSSLRMAYDFKDGGGFVVARRVWQRRMPTDFSLRFRLSGTIAGNDIEIKWIDPSNQNVWRHQIKNVSLTNRWKTFTIASKDFVFAWGPAGGGEITEIGAIEFAVVAGNGGYGILLIKDLVIEDQSFPKQPFIKTSSRKDLQSSMVRSWQAAENDEKPWITLDAGSARVCGGIIIHWADQAPHRGFRVSTSLDGKRWKKRHTCKSAGGKHSYIALTNTLSRLIKIELSEPIGISSIEIQPYEFSRSAESFWHHIAANEPRGRYPRWLYREQSLWTPVGGQDQIDRAIINEQGMCEVHEGSFSLEPFVLVDGKIHQWSDVHITQSLKDEWKPMPIVTWHGENWKLTIDSYSSKQSLCLRYQISGKYFSAKIFLAVRPFQVTPPWQKFRNLGGISRINDLTWNGHSMIVNQQTVITPLRAVAVGACAFHEEHFLDLISQGNMPRHSTIHDASGYATGVFSFDEDATIIVGDNKMDQLNDVAHYWLEKLPSCRIVGKGWINDVVKTMKTCAAHVLCTRSRFALQPGPRRYTRSWIRDSTMMCSALLRMGCAAEVREFINWYASFLRDDGFVPCCVDRDGIDPLVEHDSHGQWIALIAEHEAFCHDSAFLQQHWPSIERTMKYLANTIEATGLMPVSVSHEGYLAQPVHSYWDNFWTLRGMHDAIYLANLRKMPNLVTSWSALAEKFSNSLYQSIEQTRRTKNLSYIPASVEWADFDPTATANAIMLFDIPQKMDRLILDNTFERYYLDWKKKRSEELPWNNYTAYEIRIIGAFVRLGKRDIALELLEFFLANQHPVAWNQWPEITWKNPLSPGHIGDVPHTWISAEYVLAVQSLFAYETIDSLVIAAGVSYEWLLNKGIKVADLHTRFGTLQYSLCYHDEHTLEFSLQSNLTIPSRNIILRPPLRGKITAITCHQEAQIQDDQSAVIFTQNTIHCIIHVH